MNPKVKTVIPAGRELPVYANAVIVESDDETVTFNFGLLEGNDMEQRFVVMSRQVMTHRHAGELCNALGQALKRDHTATN